MKNCIFKENWENSHFLLKFKILQNWSFYYFKKKLTVLLKKWNLKLHKDYAEKSKRLILFSIQIVLWHSPKWRHRRALNCLKLLNDGNNEENFTIFLKSASVKFLWFMLSIFFSLCLLASETVAATYLYWRISKEIQEGSRKMENSKCGNENFSPRTCSKRH